MEKTMYNIFSENIYILLFSFIFVNTVIFYFFYTNKKRSLLKIYAILASYIGIYCLGISYNDGAGLNIHFGIWQLVFIVFIAFWYLDVAIISWAIHVLLSGIVIYHTENFKFGHGIDYTISGIYILYIFHIFTRLTEINPNKLDAVIEGINFKYIYYLIILSLVFSFDASFAQLDINYHPELYPIILSAFVGFCAGDFQYFAKKSVRITIIIICCLNMIGYLFFMDQFVFEFYGFILSMKISSSFIPIITCFVSVSVGILLRHMMVYDCKQQMKAAFFVSLATVMSVLSIYNIFSVMFFSNFPYLKIDLSINFSFYIASLIVFYIGFRWLKKGMAFVLIAALLFYLQVNIDIGALPVSIAQDDMTKYRIFFSQYHGSGGFVQENGVEILPLSFFLHILPLLIIAYWGEKVRLKIDQIEQVV